jgi:membrane fusion protein, multidrug efflux system
VAVIAVSRTTEEVSQAGTGVDPDAAPPGDAANAGQAAPPRDWRRSVHAARTAIVTTLARITPPGVAALPRRTIILIAALAACASILGWWAYGQSQQVTSRNAMVRGQISEVGTRLNGVLRAIEVREGERVDKGQVLARLDDRHLQSEAREMQAQIDGLEREAELERATVANERSKRGNRLLESQAKSAAARAEVAAAQSRAAEAREYHKARLMLLKHQMVSPEAVRDAEAKYRTATAMLDAARANLAAATSAERNTQLESIDMDLREQRIDVLLANVRAAKARLAHAEADIESALVRAPGDGAIIRWLIQPGGAVESGKAVVSMSIGTGVWIEAWIDEDEIHRVNVGGEASVTLPSHSGREFKGVVETIGLTTDVEQPTANVPQPRHARMRGAPVVGVLVRLHDAPATLLPGLSAVVAIRGAQR